MPNLWYKNAVIYNLDVRTFMDSNGDGYGDFIGLADRLDHLERLGITCIWLGPFYPSPMRDNGYDITDYYNVDPHVGSLGDFVEFMHAAEDRGMRVIVDLVANHTSIDHPWFQSARKDENSPYRDWYIWSSEKPENMTDGIVFPGVQRAVWDYDRTAKAWYKHSFYNHQPDLNTANPDVRSEILKIMGFWLALGVSGFRVDAVPFLVDDAHGSGDPIDPAGLLNDMQDFLAWRRAGAVLLAEANIPYDLAEGYFASGDRMNMIFDFVLNQDMFLSMARQTAAPVRRALQERPKAAGMGQWASFLRNHDELNLGRLSIGERTEVFEEFGSDPDMRIYERGLRRRLAGLLGGDERRIRQAFSLMLALPATPVLWFGEEIGMVENLDLPERDAVRTPMQWSDEPNAGFSKAPAKDLFRPIRKDGPGGYKTTNVADQVRRHDSLLTTLSALIGTRRSAPEVGWGDFKVVDTGDDELLVLTYEWRGNRVVTLHNFADAPKTLTLDIEGADRFVPLLVAPDGLAPFAADRPVELSAFGYCWLRCEGERR
jgi:maltose alpha-D-glucosyltransferase/alpha-amylase